MAGKQLNDRIASIIYFELAYVRGNLPFRYVKTGIKKAKKNVKVQPKKTPPTVVDSHLIRLEKKFIKNYLSNRKYTLFDV